MANREIKFRAFLSIGDNSEVKAIIENVAIYRSSHDGQTGCSIEDFIGALEEVGFVYNEDRIEKKDDPTIFFDCDEWNIIEGDDWIFFDGVPLQFTSLRDKNGKEIYEGDILSFADTYFYEVRFEDAKFVCYHLNKQYGKWGDLSRIYDVDFAKYGGIEIIGNIYEHPELLNK